MAQLAPAASVEPQVVVWVKSAAPVPLVTMLAMLRVALPVLVSVADMDAEVVAGTVVGKVRLVAESVAIGAGAVCPVPVRVTVCGEPGALSATLSAAVKPVAVAGVKFTEMLQLLLAASAEPQVFAVMARQRRPFL